MGWMDRLLGRDPGEQLARAERWLADGDPVRALETARRLDRSRDMAVRSQAASLVQQARDAVVARAVENAAAAEKANDPEDAADWIRAALQHLGDGVQRAELEARLQTFEKQLEDTPVPTLLPKAEKAEAPDRELEGAVPDLDTHYHMLIGMFVDDVARHYEDRPTDFQQAVIDLNEGRPEAARPVLDELMGRSGSDPVLHFERGRVRLMQEQWTGAREDFEAAWTDLGDQPLDRAGTLSVPLLWGEAVLEQGNPGALLDRLRELAAPDAGRPNLSALYVQALLATERRQEARDLLLELWSLHPQRQDFPHLLAQVLTQDGDRPSAIRVLEKAVAPSCASGRCAKPPLHLPSLRLLTALYLEEGGPAGRIEDLMVWISHAQGGGLAAPDWKLKARYHELVDEPEEAEQARLRAERLEREARQHPDPHPQVPGGDPSATNQKMPI